MSDPEKPAGDAPAKKKGGRGKLLVIVGVALVVLGGGGGGAYWWFARRPAAPNEERAARKKTADNGIVSFEPFVVNLADPQSQRFLRINVRLVIGEQEQAEHIQKSEVQLMRLRAGILELLTEQTSDKIVTPQGKEALKKAIEERAARVIQPAEVSDVLFSDFVVQF